MRRCIDVCVYLGAPVILTFNVTNISVFSDNTTNFPLCSFYNELNQSFNTNGSYIISMTESNDSSYIIVECAARHLTFFALSIEEFTPEINIEIFYAVGDITIDALIENPVGWIVVVSWLLVIAILIFLFDYFKPFNIYDRPRRAHKVTGTMARRLHTNRHKFRKFQQENIVYDDSIHACKRVLSLWWIYIRNDHIWYVYVVNKSLTAKLQGLQLCMQVQVTHIIYNTICYFITLFSFSG